MSATAPADHRLYVRTLVLREAYGGGSVQDPGIDVLTIQRK
jgi:hypothetical protein